MRAEHNAKDEIADATTTHPVLTSSRHRCTKLGCVSVGKGMYTADDNDGDDETGAPSAPLLTPPLASQLFELVARVAFAGFVALERTSWRVCSGRSKEVSK